uniref:TF-B3 domain-containing protein n=1 Tax=Triticum urartu TaxID=4572 RepID=A0A8R7R9W4_TRIUA
MVQGGPIPRLFPELEQAGGNGMQNERVVAVLIDAEAGKLAAVRYINSNMAYRIFGRGWSEFVRDCRISHGGRVDIYVGRRGAGQRCLLFFNSKGAQ